MAGGGEVPAPHLFQMQLQLIQEEAGGVQRPPTTGAWLPPFRAAAWWGGGRGGGEGACHHQGMLTWGGHSSAHGGMATFACLGSESDLVHPLSYLFWIIH